MGQFRVQMGQLGAKMGQLRAQMGQLGDQIGQLGAQIGQLGAQAGQLESQMGQHRFFTSFNGLGAMQVLFVTKENEAPVFNAPPMVPFVLLSTTIHPLLRE